MTSEGNQILGRIYKIVSSETDQVYVGSTTQALKTRLSVHKEKYKLYLKNVQHYVTSFDIMKFSDAKIMLIHEGLFDTKDDLRRLEGQYMLATEHCVNKCIAGRNSHERYMTRADEIKQYQVEYRNNNGDKIREQRRQFRLANKDRLCEISKDYYKNHKDNVLRRDKIYRESNADKIKARESQIIQCPVCNSCFTRGVKARHEKSLKHRSALSQASSSELPATDAPEDGVRSQSSSSEIPAIENLTSD